MGRKISLQASGTRLVIVILYALLMGCTSTPTAPTSTTTNAGEEKTSPVSITAFAEASYRETQFFQENHDTRYGLIDIRGEYWPPLGRNSFSWGPYIRLASVSSSGREAFANAYTALPGVGLQVYPLSFSTNHNPKNFLEEILGPLRLFAEYNRVHVRGEENEWRPDKQTRAGVEYWRSRSTNDPFVSTWHELWVGSIWQSSNEFDDEYDTLVSAASLKLGGRLPGDTIISHLTPYLSVDATKTQNDTYYWENKLVAGGGLRWAPPEYWFEEIGLQRFVLFAEYLWVVDYFEYEAPSSIPDYDFRFGISLSIGEWFR